MFVSLNQPGTARHFLIHHVVDCLDLEHHQAFGAG